MWSWHCAQPTVIPSSDDETTLIVSLTTALRAVFCSSGGVDERDEHAEGPGGRGLAPKDVVDRAADEDRRDQPQAAVDAEDDPERPGRLGVGLVGGVF